LREQLQRRQTDVNSKSIEHVLGIKWYLTDNWKDDEHFDNFAQTHRKNIDLEEDTVIISDLDRQCSHLISLLVNRGKELEYFDCDCADLRVRETEHAAMLDKWIQERPDRKIKFFNEVEENAARSLEMACVKTRSRLIATENMKAWHRRYRRCILRLRDALPTFHEYVKNSKTFDDNAAAVKMTENELVVAEADWIKYRRKDRILQRRAKKAAATTIIASTSATASDKRRKVGRVRNSRAKSRRARARAILEPSSIEDTMNAFLRKEERMCRDLKDKYPVLNYSVHYKKEADSQFKRNIKFFTDLIIETEQRLSTALFI
jgi:hypothetical protein